MRCPEPRNGAAYQQNADTVHSDHVVPRGLSGSLGETQARPTMYITKIAPAPRLLHIGPSRHGKQESLGTSPFSAAHTAKEVCPLQKPQKDSRVPEALGKSSVHRSIGTHGCALCTGPYIPMCVHGLPAPRLFSIPATPGEPQVWL